MSMIAKYVFASPTIEDGEESNEFKEIKRVKLDSVKDLIEVLQKFMEEHPKVEFDLTGGEISFVEWGEDGETSHWLDIEDER